MKRNHSTLLKPSTILIVLFLSVLIPTAAYSGTITFTDRATWESAVTGIIQTEDFNSISPFGFPANGRTPVGLISVETVNAKGYTGVLPGTDSLNLNGSTFVRFYTDGTPVRTAAIIFPELVTAWGMDWSEYARADDTHITFGADISNQTLFNLTGAHSGFVGFVSDTGFTQVEFSDPYISFADLVFDDLSFVEVPEPATLSLLAIGGLALLRRRRGCGGQALLRRRKRVG